MSAVFVAIGASGTVYTAPTQEAAYARLREANDVGRGTWMEGANGSEARDNEGGMDLGKVVSNMGLRVIPHQPTITAREAFDRLRPVFAGLYDARKRGPNVPTMFGSVSAFVDGLLQPNAKQEKSTTKAASDMSYSGVTRFAGLNLLPAAKLVTDFPTWMERYDAKGTPYWTEMPFYRDILEGKLANVPPATEAWKTLGFCPGSSKDCRDSCLVFTGSNKSEPYNDVRKAALSAAVLYDFEAFTRLLHEAIHRKARGQGLWMLRLNLLSDIPWEYVAPWIFDNAPPNVLFYDYTKIYARIGRQKPNYDLTFSFSGRNGASCEKALANGHRIAAALLMYRPEARGGQTIYRPMGSTAASAVKPPVEWEIWGGKWRTTDADVNDARPFDPVYSPFVARRGASFGLARPASVWDEPTIGVLRWKSPKGSTVKPETSTFAVKGPRSEQVSYVTKAQWDPKTGFLLTPVTPRSEGVDAP